MYIYIIVDYCLLFIWIDCLLSGSCIYVSEKIDIVVFKDGVCLGVGEVKFMIFVNIFVDYNGCFVVVVLGENFC